MSTDTYSTEKATMRKVLEATPEELVDPDYVFGEIFWGDSGGKQGIVADFAIRLRLSLETRKAIQAADESATRLQHAANSLSPATVYVAAVATFVAVAQAWPLLFGN